MLIRPDAGPGCSWMKRMQQRVAGPSASPEPLSPRLRWIWGGYLFLMLALLLVPLTRPWVSVTLDNTGEYQSPMRISGMPVIALGARPSGGIAIGERATGLIAIGGLALGGIALGGGAIGWCALGGGAVGRYALGGLAIGDYAYAGNGLAYGVHEAAGRPKEKLLK